MQTTDKVILRTLDITEQMYDYVFKQTREEFPEDWPKLYIQVKTERQWKKLLETPSEWHPCVHYYYQKKDSKGSTMNRTYILSRKHIFGDCKLPAYGKELRPSYYYIWTYCPEDEIKAGQDVGDSLSGAVAFKMVYSMIKRFYSDTEINEIIKQFGTEEEAEIRKKTQLLWTECNEPNNTVLDLSNVYYFDINKAYASNLIKFFPRLKNWIMRGYKKNKPYFKKVINYAVGCFNRMFPLDKEQELLETAKAQLALNPKDRELAKKVKDLESNIELRWDVPFNFRALRRTIVKNTTELIDEAVATTNNSSKARLIYENTDGFFIQNPAEIIRTSKEVGDWGMEQVDKNRVWAIRIRNKDYENYSIIQYYEDGEKVIKSLGGFRQESKLTNKVDLSKGKAVLFTTMKCYDQDGSGIKVIDEIKEFNYETKKC